MISQSRVPREEQFIFTFNYMGNIGYCTHLCLPQGRWVLVMVSQSKVRGVVDAHLQIKIYCVGGKVEGRKEDGI